MTNARKAASNAEVESAAGLGGATTVKIGDRVNVCMGEELIATVTLKRFGASPLHFSGAGIVASAAADAKLRAVFFSGAIHDWKVVSGSTTWQGPFQVTSLEYTGISDEGGVDFDISLTAAGSVSRAPQAQGDGVAEALHAGWNACRSGAAPQAGEDAR